MKTLVEEGTWLTERTRSGLAHWAVIRAHQPEDLRPWLMTLPDSISSRALAAMESFLNDEALREAAPPDLSDLRKLSDFLYHQSPNQPFSTWDWTSAELESFRAEVKEITPGQASRLYGMVTVDHFPLSVRVLLVPKILADARLAKLGGIKMLVKKTTQEYADSQPAVAAQWVMTFPDESLRFLGVAIVADRWKSQNEDEARGWIASLPDAWRERLGN